MSNLRERLKAEAHFNTEIVELKVTSGTASVEVREMSAGLRDRFSELAYDANRAGSGKGLIKAQRMLVAESTFDPDTGERVWPSGAMADMDEISGSSQKRLIEVAMRLNALDEDALVEAKKD